MKPATSARPSPPPAEIWLIRHGETAANRDRIVQGHTDVPLHEDGEQQARMLGARLRAAGLEIDAVVSSDLLRARRTADLACAHLDLPIEPDATWREACFGDLEGRPGRELQEFREAAGTQADGVAPPGDGAESLLQLQARSAAAFHRLAARPFSRQLVFTHGGPIAGVVAHVLGAALTSTFQRAFRRDNTGITIVRRRAGSGPAAASSDPERAIDPRVHRHVPHWHLVTVNDTAHLDS